MQNLKNYSKQNKNIIVLGFPSNNFGAQEPGTDEEIAKFCKINFGVTFQLFKKDDVKGNNRQPVYQWLGDENKNGWNNEEPGWNFYKYLIDENGNLLKYFLLRFHLWILPVELLESSTTFQKLHCTFFMIVDQLNCRSFKFITTDIDQRPRPALPIFHPFLLM